MQVRLLINQKLKANIYTLAHFISNIICRFFNVKVLFLPIDNYLKCGPQSKDYINSIYPRGAMN